MERDYGSYSLWLDSTDEDLAPRSALPGDVDVDVAIVGAGYTGLWTAYYLAKADPTLRIAVLEKEIAGYGASGRNGGWASALFPASRAKLAALPGSSPEGARRQIAHMRATVGEIERVCTAESIQCDYARGGTVVFARTPSQLARAEAEVAESRQWGDTDDDLRLLSAAEADQVAAAAGALGATYTPHCARLHPAKLVRGRAAAGQRRGVTLFEQTAGTGIAPSCVTTDRGRVRADVVVRATEGYTARLPGSRRDLAPVYSLLVATEPLPAATWEAIGLHRNETFSDHRHLVIYGQRTADGRLAFGGRGAPYHFGSGVSPAFDTDDRVFAGLRETLVDLFPAVRGAAFTHAWGGPLGIPRDWVASVDYDLRTGLARAGGYVGDGVSTANLAGRTLTDLILRRETELTRLPWVGHRSRRWEPEPARWLGVNTGLRTMTAADAEERRTGRPSRLAKAMAPLLGGS